MKVGDKMNRFKIGDIVKIGNSIWEIIDTGTLYNHLAEQEEQNINIELLSNNKIKTWIFSRYAEKAN